MTKDEEADLIADVEQAKSRLRTSLKKSKALIADYRTRLGQPTTAANLAKARKPILPFNR